MLGRVLLFAVFVLSAPQTAALCLINNTSHDSLLFQMKCSLLDSNCSRMLRVKKRQRLCYSGVGYITVMKKDPAYCTGLKLPKENSILLATDWTEGAIRCQVVEYKDDQLAGGGERIKTKNDLTDEEVSGFKSIERLSILMSSVGHLNRHVLNREISELEAKMNINVAIEEVAADDIQKILLARAIEEKLPDIAIVPSDVISLRDYLTLSPVPKSIQNRKISKSALSSVKIDGTYFGAPLYDGNFLFLYYNKERVSKPATAIEAIFSEAEDSEIKSELIGWPVNSPFWFIVMASSFGLKLTPEFAENMDVPTLTSALDFYDSLMLEGYLESFCDISCQANQFLSGKRKYLVNGDWFVDDASRVMGDRLGVSTLPTVNGVPTQAYRSSIAMIFPNKGLVGKKRRTLRTFIKHLQSESAQSKFADSSFRIPVHTGVRKQMVQPGYPRSELWEKILPMLDEARPLPPSKPLPHVWIGIDIGLKAFLEQSVNTAEAAEIIVEAAVIGRDQ